MQKIFAFFISAVLFFLIPMHSGFSLEQDGTLPTDTQKPPQSDIMLVLDNSGSMIKNDPNFLMRDVVTNFLRGFGDTSRIGMVIFDQQARLVEPLIGIALPEVRAEFMESLDAVNYKGQFSDSPAGIERAVYELKRHGRIQTRKAIIVLTDGIVDTGNKERDVEKIQWLKADLVRDCKQAGIRIFGIAFTDKADFSLMQALAFNTDGEYFRAYRAEDIQNVFVKIKELITKPPAKTAPSKSPGIEPVIESVKPAAATIAPATPPMREPPPVREESRSWLPLFIGIFVLLCIIVMIMVFYKSHVSKTSVAVAETPGYLPKKSSSVPKIELIDVNKVTSGKTAALKKRIVSIGRDPNNDIVIPEDTVSSLHATIEYTDGYFYVEDQRSKNKTYLNGKEIEPNAPVKLKSGDAITFNIYTFKFIVPHLIPSGETLIDFNSTAETVIRSDTVVSPPDSATRNVSPLPQAMLIDAKNITAKKTFALSKSTISIGRDANNDVAIPEDTVSGFHATIEYKDGFFYLEDQRSKNKTCLNGKEIEPNAPVKLKSGDEITFDVYKFIFLLERQLPSGDTDERW